MKKLPFNFNWENIKLKHLLITIIMIGFFWSLKGIYQKKNYETNSIVEMFQYKPFGSNESKIITSIQPRELDQYYKYFEVTYSDNNNNKRKTTKTYPVDAATYRIIMENLINFHKKKQ
ncbi:MAG: hypothetical protein Q8784_01990 [Vigna little leaf phytoplasma]|nr:hypothetical protein [Vigna little leaf phytoplasma]